ncbi:hypothetical protein CMV_007243 [Castanea mollissima]|uniref:Uncharacterized protein n=1 Tax=Castanea mollissima TaxID=60419 RepID=A0A8J4W0G3_9ROSI|nr:hypothetical protein CMV_007243 [Castanea mollissima]
MSNSAIDVPPKGGFSFDLCRRNDMLSKKGVQPPSYRRTGTTIVGLVFQIELFFTDKYFLTFELMMMMLEVLLRKITPLKEKMEVIEGGDAMEE